MIPTGRHRWVSIQGVLRNSSVGLLPSFSPWAQSESDLSLNEDSLFGDHHAEGEVLGLDHVVSSLPQLYEYLMI